MAAKETVEYPAGKTIFTVGEPGGDLIIVQSGKVGVYKQDEKGKEVIK